MESNDFVSVYSALFIFSLIFLSILTYFIDNYNSYRKEWKYFTHLFLNQREDNILETRTIFTMANRNFEDDFELLFNSVRKVRKYSLKNELKIINYIKFSNIMLNYAHGKMIKKFMDERPNECLFFQNMSNPRDYFELIGTLLINDLKVVISILVVEPPKNFFQDDFSVVNILLGGSHIFYGKNNKKLDIIIHEQKFNGINVIVGEGDNVKDFFKEIRNDFFEIDLYKTDGALKYGVSIIKNNYRIDKINLLYLGQLYIS